VQPELKLTLNRPINLLCVESHDDRTVNDNHRSGHVTKFLKIGQGARILRYVPLSKLYAILRKILFRLVAEHSPMLGINHDVLHHSSPPAWGFAASQQPLDGLLRSADSIADRIVRINRLRWSVLP
jgi:hypothetical protein